MTTRAALYCAIHFRRETTHGAFTRAVVAQHLIQRRISQPHSNLLSLYSRVPSCARASSFQFLLLPKESP